MQPEVLVVVSIAIAITLTRFGVKCLLYAGKQYSQESKEFARENFEPWRVGTSRSAWYGNWNIRSDLFFLSLGLLIPAAVFWIIGIASMCKLFGYPLLFL